MNKQDRISIGLSIRDIAECMGVNAETVFALEAGERLIDRGHVEALYEGCILRAQRDRLVVVLSQVYDNLSWHPDDTKEQLIGYIKDVQDQIRKAIEIRGSDPKE